MPPRAHSPHSEQAGTFALHGHLDIDLQASVTV